MNQQASRRVGQELSATYYDAKFGDAPQFYQHYSASLYYGLWSVILDRLRPMKVRRILEIGCGTGQLANAVADMGLAQSYLGLDFSQVAIDQARKTNPKLTFRCADVQQDRALEEADYNIVLSTEFLEHIEGDLAVINRIRPGSVVIASVPNFPHREHVRHFANAQEVHDRYSGAFERLYVVPIVHRLLANGYHLKHFLLQGRRKPA